MQRLGYTASAVLAIGLMCAACGSGRTTLSTATTEVDDTSVDTSAVTETVATTDATATTSLVTTTAVVATTAPSTTVAATTVPATEPATTVPATTVPTVPGGWVAASFGPELYAPFDDSNFVGVPSPALPSDPGTPLADGIYHAETTSSWSASSPSTIAVTVHRLERCTNLPENACISYGDPFAPTEMGIDESSSLALTVPLDASIGVGVTGTDCEGVVKSANGADLLDLFVAFDQAYAAVVKPLVDAGLESYEIMQAIGASPAQGFGGHAPECTYDEIYEVVYHHGDAPPILLQTMVATRFDSSGNVISVDPLTPTDALRLTTISVSGGVMTLYFYAGFLS